jgi:hypothetical protein
MPIVPFLKGQAFDPEHIQAMSAALGQVSRTLGVGDPRSLETIAARIIELARRGERDAGRLTERVLYESGFSETAHEAPQAPWHHQIRR